MNKIDLLNLLECAKQSYLINVNDANKGTILNYFESEGIIPRHSKVKVDNAINNETPIANDTNTQRSSTSDLMEMDIQSNNGAGSYSINKTTSTNNIQHSNKPVKQDKQASIPTDKSSLSPDNSIKRDSVDNTSSDNNKSDIIQRKSDPSNTTPNESDTPKSESTDIVNKNHGYPEIKLSEDLKTVDDKALEGIITKDEVTKILNASDSDKIDIYRNILLIKASDVGSSDLYRCFTTGKGGASMTNGDVPSSYIDTYYISNGTLNNPKTNEPYSIFLSKNRATTESSQYIVLNSKPSKYCVYTTNNDGEIVTIFNKKEFDLLFHLVEHD